MYQIVKKKGKMYGFVHGVDEFMIYLKCRNLKVKPYGIPFKVKMLEK